MCGAPCSAQFSTKEEKLSTEKDEASVTAICGMSVLNIALLKELLDVEQEQRTTPYLVLLGLIVWSFVMQLVTALVVVLASRQLFWHLLPKGPFWRHSLPKTRSLNVAADKPLCTEVPARTPRELMLSADGMPYGHETTLINSRTDLHVPTAVDTPNCYPRDVDCIAKSNKHGSIGNKASVSKKEIRRFDRDGSAKSTSNTKESLSEVSEVDVRCLEDILRDARQKLTNLESMTSTTNLRDFQAQCQEIQASFRGVDNRKAACMHARRHFDKVRKQRVLNRVASWQRAINIALYSVFLLNTTITGLWLIYRPMFQPSTR